MFRYGQFCPIAKALEVLGERWTLLVARELLMGSTQFSQLQRGLPKISPTTLSKRLAEMQDAGLVVRRRIPQQDGHEYRLTAAGRELQPLIGVMAEWGMRWARAQMADDELDVGALMADIERRLVPEALPGGRTVLHFRFTDLDRFGAWWVRIDGGDVEVCLHDPGDDVDVYFTSTLRTLTEVWMGDVALSDARRSGALKVVGHDAWLRTLSAWFPLHVLAAHPRPGRGSS
ncbi:MAG TPA: winged helix-turn-helix transcriptional regulator [Albitalea sp.]